jgi:hypothetical protein
VALLYSLDQILSAICVLAGFLLHQSTPSSVRCLCSPVIPGSAQPPALPTELSGNKLYVGRIGLLIHLPVRSLFLPILFPLQDKQAGKIP